MAGKLWGLCLRHLVRCTPSAGTWADIGRLIAIGEDKGERPRCAEDVGLRSIAGIPAWRQAGMASANGMPLADVIGAR
jgi:hypothetical protein